jgi:hypothetical protein
LIYLLRSSQSRDTLRQLLCSCSESLLLQYACSMMLCALCSVLCALLREGEAERREKKGIGSDINMFEQTDRWPASNQELLDNPAVDISLQEAAINLNCKKLFHNLVLPYFSFCYNIVVNYRLSKESRIPICALRFLILGSVSCSSMRIVQGI